MKNTKKKIIKLLLLLLLVGTIVGGVPGPNYLKAKRITQAVLSLPVGSSRVEIEGFLQREGIEHSYVGDKESIDFSSTVKENGYTSDHLSGYIMAMIRNTRWGFPVTGDVVKGG